MEKCGVRIMKNAPVQTTNEGAPDSANSNTGTLPNRVNTVTAAVLASLLESRSLTGMESVFKQSTTRLGAVIHRLERGYGWRINRRDMATGTNDGRIATIASYWIPQEAIGKAFEAGARNWIERVKVARAERRKLSDKCKTEALKINARRHFDPRQENLWGV